MATPDGKSVPPSARRADALLPMSRYERFWHAAGGCTLLGLLAVARLLQPSEFGFGTHEALGLPPCSAIVWLGMPCPTCGMTTSWAYLLRGNIGMSWKCNPGGTCLALVALFTGVWALQNSIAGTYRAWLSIQASSIAAMTITAITIIHWIGRIF